MKNWFVVLPLILAGCSKPPATGVDPELAAEIAKIKAIDNHAHPVRPAFEVVSVPSSIRVIRVPESW